MGGDAKSPQHTSLHPMYVSYTSLPQSATTTQINNNNINSHINNDKIKSLTSNSNNNHFGVVLKSINHSNTNSLSSTYFSNNHQNNISFNSNLKLHKPASHYQLVDHHQLNNSGSHNSLTGFYNKSNLSKSASTNQVLIKRNPSFNSCNRSDIRYTEIIAATDDFLNQLSSEDLVGNDTGSVKSYLISSPISTGSPVTKKLLANSPQHFAQGRQFGIQNPFNNLMKLNKLQNLIDEDSQSNSNSSNGFMDYDSNHSTMLIQHQQQPKQMPPPLPPHQNLTHHQHHQIQPKVPPHGVRPEFNLNKYLNSQIGMRLSQECLEAQDKVNNLPYVARSPNLSRISRRRLSQQGQVQSPNLSQTGPQMETSNSNSKLSSANYDLIRDQPTPPRYNNQFLNQTIFEDPHAPTFLHRAKSQDRLSQRYRRPSNHQSNGKQSQRPRSFCSNNMINYNDYKDYQ